MLSLLALVNISSAEIIQGIDIEFVNIENAGNSPDTGGTVGCGAVNYNYRIGKYEISNDQWNQFTDTAGAPTGNDGGYNYVAEYFTSPQLPTNKVSWYEALQFCNFASVAVY